ncbi:MAG: hypothetical protein IJ357_05265 [Oscillospiraceae bacterium]|nr:hypothetical protein [Oscillospiraceae bacterium]
MKNIFALILVLTCAFALLGCAADTQPSRDAAQETSAPTEASHGQLTLERIVELSEREIELTLADFELYQHTVTGSGLTIYLYQIDENYTLHVGIGSSSSLMYINLVYNEGKPDQASIDIRIENVAKFINSHTPGRLKEEK